MPASAATTCCKLLSVTATLLGGLSGSSITSILSCGDRPVNWTARHHSNHTFWNVWHWQLEANCRSTSASGEFLDCFKHRAQVSISSKLPAAVRPHLKIDLQPHSFQRLLIVTHSRYFSGSKIICIAAIHLTCTCIGYQCCGLSTRRARSLGYAASVQSHLLLPSRKRRWTHAHEVHTCGGHIWTSLLAMFRNCPGN